MRRLSACTGRMNWPRCGVYFFFEDIEKRSDSGDGPRVVRVVTHPLTSSSSTLSRSHACKLPYRGNPAGFPGGPGRGIACVTDGFSGSNQRRAGVVPVKAT